MASKNKKKSEDEPIEKNYVELRVILRTIRKRTFKTRDRIMVDFAGDDALYRRIFSRVSPITVKDFELACENMKIDCNQLRLLAASIRGNAFKMRTLLCYCEKTREGSVFGLGDAAWYIKQEYGY